MLRLSPARRAFTGIVLGFSLLATVIIPRPAQAAGPVTLPQGPLPIGELEPVEFSYLTIDGTVVPTANGLAVQVETKLRLRNPDKKNDTSRLVSYPNPASDVTGAREAEDQPGAWSLGIPANGGAVIEAKQSAGAEGAIAHLRFDWGALAPWGDNLAATRLTLHFPKGLDPEQLLSVDPAPVERDTLRLSWSYEKFNPTGVIDVVLISPGPWQTLRNARQAAASEQAGAAQHLALAAALRPLIEAEGMPAGRVAAMRDEELAALRQAVALDGNSARAHKELGLALAARAGGNPTLLAEAVSELKAGYDLAPNDSDLKAALLQKVDELLEACRQVGDNQGLLAALDVAQAVDSRHSAERLAAYAEVAVSYLQAGRQQEAEALIVAGFGQEALDRYAYVRPQFAAIDGEIQTRSGQRDLSFTLTPNAAAGPAAEGSVTTLLDALKKAGLGQVKRTAGEGQASHIEITLPVTGNGPLQTGAAALIAGLPTEADPALTLVAAAIGAPRVEWSATQGRWSDRMAYAESVDLSRAQSALDERMEQLKAARAEAETATDDPAEAARRRWAAPLLKLYDQQWQQLTQRSHITYRVLPEQGASAPHWVVAWGEKRELNWTATVSRLERLIPYVAGGGVALVALIALISFVLGRRKR